CLPFGDQAGSVSPRVVPAPPAAPARSMAVAPHRTAAHVTRLASPPILCLVLDWDGTVTVRDTQWMLLERFGDREVFARMEGALGTTRTYREGVETEVGTITAPLEEAVAFLVAEAEIRPGFRALAERFRPLIL